MTNFAAPMTDTEIKTKNLILTKAMQLYMQYGFRSVSMDQIASELGMSKKTIYRFFSSKSDLVHDGIDRLANEVKAFAKEIQNNTPNPIDALFEMDKAMLDFFTPSHQRMLFQLSKYFPETYTFLECTKKDEMMEATMENLESGIKQGYYRDDIDPETIAHLYLGHAYIMTNDEYFWSAENQTKLRRQALLYHLNGIVSEKGRKHLKKYPTI